MLALFLPLLFSATTVSIAGTLTYQDVTNIDSVGIITARSGIDVTSGNVNIDSVTSNTPLVVQASQNNRSRIVFRNNVETGTECNIELFDDDLRFVTNSGERLRIDVNGKIGISSTAPKTDVDISQKTGAVALPQGTTAQTDWFGTIHKEEHHQ